MAVGDRKTLVTQEFVDSIYDKKTNSTDDLNTYDSGKRATAKAVALLNDRIDEVKTTIAGLSGGGGGGIYFQDTEPVLNPGQKALWVKEFPDGSFDILIVKG